MTPSAKAIMNAILIVATSCLAAAAGEEAAAKGENPYRAARVGDYAEFSLVNEVEGEKSQGVVRMELIGKDGKEAVVRVDVSLAEQEQPPQEQKINLAEAYDPWQPLAPEAQVEKIAEGDEIIRLGDKTYNCRWQEMRITVPMLGGKSITVSKCWFAREAPLSGLVKMESRFESQIGQEKITSTATMALQKVGNRQDEQAKR